MNDLIEENLRLKLQNLTLQGQILQREYDATALELQRVLAEKEAQSETAPDPV